MVSNEWIDKQIVYLTSRLGIYKLESGQDFFFEPTGGFYGFIAQGQVQSLNEAMRMLAEHISSRSVPVIEDWEDSTDFLTTSNHDFASDDELPGFIKYDGPHRSRIKIGFMNKHSPFVMGSILAHELTHHFLINKDIGYPDIDENERFTDFATVYLGLGKLTINGYEPISWTIKRVDKQIRYTYKVGYLSQIDMAAIMRRVCTLRKIPVFVANRNLSDNASQLLIKEYYDIINVRRYEIMRDSIISFFKRILHRSDKNSSEKSHGIDFQKVGSEEFIVMKCVNCEKKLRMPVIDYNLRITCPICRNKFIMKPKYQI